MKQWKNLGRLELQAGRSLESTKRPPAKMISSCPILGIYMSYLAFIHPQSRWESFSSRSIGTTDEYSGYNIAWEISLFTILRKGIG